MGVVYTQGQILDRGDLDIFLRNASGNPTNAAEITYAIYWTDPNPPGLDVLIGSAARVPLNPAVGEYYASIMIPTSSTLGDYKVKWTFREFAGGPQSQVVQEFGVVSSTLIAPSNPLGMSAYETDLVRSLRILIRDQNPDRNYHFRPPEHESQIGQYNRVFGYVWEDYELLEYLRTALGWWNMQPPNTASALCSLSALGVNPMFMSWRTAILWGAIVHAMFALATNWVHDEFDYSIGGISLSIERSSKYESLKQNAEGQLDKAVEAKRLTYFITKGLQQPKYGRGIRSSFGPALGSGILSPRSFI